MCRRFKSAPAQSKTRFLPPRSDSVAERWHNPARKANAVGLGLVAGSRREPRLPSASAWSQMIVDHIERIDLPDDFPENHHNVVNSLYYVWEGLEYLYQEMIKAEEEGPRLPGVARPAGSGLLFADGGVRACGFHWYAVSAVNFVGLMGWVIQQHNPSFQDPRHYIKTVLPDVSAFRNKVTGHFAQWDHRDHNNIAEELASMIPPTAWVNGRLTASSLQVRITRGGKTSTSKAISPWSLTKVHEELRERYRLFPVTPT